MWLLSHIKKKKLPIVKETEEELKDYNLKIIGKSNEDAAKEGDILILTVSLAAQKPTLESIKDFVNGKILLDVTVPLETTIGGKPSRFIDLMESSAAERSAKILKNIGAKVICAFSNISKFSFIKYTKRH